MGRMFYDLSTVSAEDDNNVVEIRIHNTRLYSCGWDLITMNNLSINHILSSYFLFHLTFNYKSLLQKLLIIYFKMFGGNTIRLLVFISKGTHKLYYFLFSCIERKIILQKCIKRFSILKEAKNVFYIILLTNCWFKYIFENIKPFLSNYFAT